MVKRGEAPEGRISDAVDGNWVDSRAPERIRPYLRLSRADRPVGAWLLLLPCWWGLLLAMAHTGRAGLQDLWIAAGCAAGAWLMRGAGCTWNDIADRRLDAAVARTRSRPIPSGRVTVRRAVIWMVLQMLPAFAILLTFPPPAIAAGVASLALVCVYPFAKRFTWWPQIFLGLAFNWGALLAWIAHTGGFGWPPLALWLAGIAWTLFYDTIYAHQDKEDDALIGIKSTARLFAGATETWLRAFLAMAVLLFAAAAILAIGPGRNLPALGAALGGAAGLGLHLAWQLRELDIDDPDNCLRLFRTNRDAGLIPTLFLTFALLI